MRCAVDVLVVVVVLAEVLAAVLVVVVVVVVVVRAVVVVVELLSSRWRGQLADCGGALTEVLHELGADRRRQVGDGVVQRCRGVARGAAIARR